MIMPLGMGNITLKFFPKIRNEQNKHNGFFLLLLLLSSLGALIVGVIIFMNKGFFIGYYKNSANFPNYFNEAIVFGYILSLVSVYSVYSASILKTSFTVFLTDIFTRVGQLVLVVVYSYGGMERDALVISYIGVFALQLMILIGYLLWIKQVSIKINWKFFGTLDKREIIAFAGLMTLTSFASLGIKFIDQLMIGHFLDESAVGIYATSVMICVVMEIPFNSLERIAQPKIAEAWNFKRTAEIQTVYEMSSRYMFFLGSVLFCLLWAGIDFFYQLIPAEYSAGRAAFYIMSVSSLINLLTGVNSSIISLSHKYFMSSVLLLVLIGVAFFANNIFIEPLGISGAAIATLLSIGSFNILKYFYILLRFKMQPFSKQTLFIFIGLLICFLFICALGMAVSPLVKAILGSVFTIAVFSILNIKFETIPEINKLFRKFKIIR